MSSKQKKRQIYKVSYRFEISLTEDDFTEMGARTTCMVIDRFREEGLRQEAQVNYFERHFPSAMGDVAVQLLHAEGFVFDLKDRKTRTKMIETIAVDTKRVIRQRCSPPKSGETPLLKKDLDRFTNDVLGAMMSLRKSGRVTKVGIAGKMYPRHNDPYAKLSREFKRHYGIPFSEWSPGKWKPDK